jgi:integrase
MTKVALTAKRITRLLQSGRGRYRDDEVKGLLLVVVSATNASWQLRYQIHNRERWLGLGSVQDVPLKRAREKARVARGLLADGLDPVERKQANKTAAALAAANTITFETAAMEYCQQHSLRWRNAKSPKQFLSSMKEYVFPKIGRLPVAGIDVGLVLRVLEQPVPPARNLPGGRFCDVRAETASRVRARIHAVLDWSTARGYRVGDNPAAGSVISKAVPKRSQIAKPVNFAALPYAEIPQFMAELRQREGVAARALEFLILTGARTGEIRGAPWTEIDLDGKVWTVPKERMKMGKEHRVPLCDRAIEILRDLPHERGNDHVFIGPVPRKGLPTASMLHVLERMGLKVTAHGFRSCLMDWAHEQPPGLLNGITPLTASTATGLDAMIADLGAIGAALGPASGGSTPIIVASPGKATSLRLFANGDLDIYSSNALPAGTVVGVVPAGVATIVEAPRIDISGDVEIQAQDAPTDDPLTSGPTFSMFQKDSVVLRLLMPATWAIRSSSAVAFVQSVQRQ